MAIYVYTSKPHSLLKEIREAAKTKRVETWQCDSDGDFTHTPEQWNRSAWLRPKVEEGTRIIFNILAPKGVVLSRLMYGVYHGRFVEMILVHFDEKCERVIATSMPSPGDAVGAR